MERNEVLDGVVRDELTTWSKCRCVTANWAFRQGLERTKL